jgi:hypothetical protein
LIAQACEEAMTRSYAERHVRQEVAPPPAVPANLPDARQRAEPRLADDAARELVGEDFAGCGEREDVGLLVLEETRANEINDPLRAVHSLKPVVRDRRRFVEQHEAETITHIRGNPFERVKCAAATADERG